MKFLKKVIEQIDYSEVFFNEEERTALLLTEFFGGVEDIYRVTQTSEKTCSIELLQGNEWLDVTGDYFEEYSIRSNTPHTETALLNVILEVNNSQPKELYQQDIEELGISAVVDDEINHLIELGYVFYGNAAPVTKEQPYRVCFTKDDFEDALLAYINT